MRLYNETAHFSLPELNDSGHQSTIAEVEGELSSMWKAWVPTHSQAATSSLGCSCQLTLMSRSCQKWDFMPRSYHLSYHSSPDWSAGGTHDYSVVVAASLTSSLGMAPFLPAAHQCFMAPSGAVQGKCRVSLSHFCQCFGDKHTAFMSFIMFKMFKTVHPQCPVTGNILIFCYRAEERGWWYSVCRVINTIVTWI